METLIQALLALKVANTQVQSLHTDKMVWEQIDTEIDQDESGNTDFRPARRGHKK